ncbi:hypothetical protein BGZ80_007800, partial [Entomortierella chlamydospora]
MWENLSVSAQVVLRHAPMSVTEISLDSADGSTLDQMTKLFDPRSYRIDLTQAPLIRFAIAQNTDGTWIAVQLMHHIIGDHSTMEVMAFEIDILLKSQDDSLLLAQPFRNLIAKTRSSASFETHEQFFTNMLGEIDTPALPYGHFDVHNDDTEVHESQRVVAIDLNNRLRSHAKRMGVGLASLCHLAWAQVISRTSGQERVVFGTVLFGRMQGGSGTDQAMGLYINTLPLRIDVEGASVEESVRQTQASLAALLEHEHAPLAIAQRCSSIPAGSPVFSAMLNCRHHSDASNNFSSIAGVVFHDEKQRTTFPFVMNVDDLGSGLSLTAQVVYPFEASRICAYMEQALHSLADALDWSPNMPVRKLEILPAEEREMLVKSWNTIESTFPDHHCIHNLFEDQVEQSPDSIAIVFQN